MKEARLEAIEQELLELDSKRKALMAERESLLKKPREDAGGQILLSTDQKIDLFMSLFRGRQEMFAQRWQNSKGRSGYSVACENEWVPKLCHKPKIKCMDCSHQNFRPITKQVIYGHLTGKSVVGLYPLLEDNTCFLLAIDFDKSDWRDSVSAAARACIELNIPHAIEISKSGQGAHLWVFFKEPVPAKYARLMGFCVLDKAMETYPKFSFESYDRLFPNQDIMPEGGFGNLIALPLQYQYRQRGATEFVNIEMKPYEDQWNYLSQVKTISTDQLYEILATADPNKFDFDRKSGLNLLPWEQSAKVVASKIENVPNSVTITLANHLYLKMDDLPTQIIARIRRIASFSNPVFFKTQAMRFSTHGIPRYITCARIENGPGGKKWLSLPRGCFDDVCDLLSEQNVKVNIDDKRNLGKPLVSLKFLGKLRKAQNKAVNAIARHDTGVLHAPTAFGKTITAIGVIKKRKTSTLILTHSKQLLQQWQDRLNAFVEGVEVGVFHGGKKQLSGQIDIATYQSLINKKDNTVNEVIQDYGQIIIDECHHISAPRFEMVLNEVRAKYVLGLTATPNRQDGHQKIIFMISGPIRHHVKPTHSDQFEQKVIACELDYLPPSELVGEVTRPKISEVYNWIIGNTVRTEKIVADVAVQVALGRHPLVLTERRQHADDLYQLLADMGFSVVILRGAMNAKDQKSAKEKLRKAQVVVATGRYIGEGFDLPRLDTLFLSMPIAWKGSLAQYAGRIHRESEGKEQVTIFDYVDASIPMFKRMFKKREKGYKLMGYEIEERGGDF